MTETLSTGARYLKRGDTFDIEDSRMTHRLRIAHRILAGQGIEPTTNHVDSPDAYDRFTGKHACTYRCTTDWPEWVGVETFNAAFALANAIQNERGGFNQAAANALHNAR